MNFDLDDDQRLLVDSVQTFVRKESPVSRFRALRSSGEGASGEGDGFSRDVYRKMGELGWLALPLPESVGGLGGRFVDLALVLEQLGTTLVPEPILSSIVLSAMTVAELGGDRFLDGVATGERLLALAYAERGSRYDLARIETTAEPSGAGHRLRGEKLFVLDGHAADAFVVSARLDGKVALFVVEAKDAEVRRLKTHDGRWAAHVTFDVDVPHDRLLAADGLPALERAIERGAAAACAEGLGIMQTVLWMTRDYLNQREQFGVKIGSFQALQHRCVDMFVETELARSTMLLAALALHDPKSVSVAKVQLAAGGRYVVQQAVQLHGGIGITDEADVGLYFKRMHVLQALFGDEDFHLARVARLGLGS